MDNCTYTIISTGQKFNSWAELMNNFADKEIKDFNSLSDVVFSKYKRRDDVRESLVTLSKEYVSKKRGDDANSAVSTLIDGEPALRDSNVISISEWIDHPSCQIDGRPLITQMVKEDYIESEINNLINQGVSEDDAKKAVETVINNWKIIEEDSMVLHSLFTSSTIGNVADFENAQDLTKRMSMQVIDKLHGRMQHFIKQLRYKYPEAKILTNINLKTELKGFDKELLGHIDYMVIDKRGNLHLYNFKSSHTHYSKWASVKQEKYKLQLAFLKQMLANKGIQVKNMSLNIVPVEIDYTDDFSKIDDIKVFDPINYNLNKFSNPGLNKYFNKAKYFVQSTIPEIEDVSKGIKEANAIINATFPTLNIKAEGIATSAKDWIKNAPNSGDASTPIIIKPSERDDYAYDLIINGKTYEIKSRKRIENNKEIEEKVIEHLSELEDNKDFITQQLKTVLDKAIKVGFIDCTGHKIFKKDMENHLKSVFEKYLVRDEESKEPDWEFSDSLIDQNVFLFRNKHTGQTDVISLSHLNLNSSIKIKGYNNILGAYKRDGEIDTLSSHYGNIETIRTLLLLNSVFPEIEGSDMKLGQLKVLSPMMGSHTRTYDIGNLVKNYLPEILQTVQENNTELEVKNNLKYAEMVDKVSILLNEYNTIMENRSENTRDNYATMGFAELEVADSKAAQILAIRNILNQLFDDYKNVSTAEIERNAREKNNIKDKLFILVSDAYKYLTGEYPAYSKKLTWNDINVTTAPTVPNKNINMVVTNFLTTADTIAENTMSQWEKYRPSFMSFYEAIGYGTTQNAVIGNQSSQFNNLYALDENNKKTMMFKDPYNMENDLKPEERTLLKNVLSYLYEIRRTFNPSLKEITDVEEYIKKNPSYLQVPLMRASTATILQRKESIKNAGKNLAKIALHPEKYWDEFVENLMPEEAEEMNEGAEVLSLVNNFEKQHDQEYRNRLIQKHGVDYFETNLEDILLTVLNKYVQVDKMNTFLIGTKNLIFQLEMLQDISGTKDIIEKEIKYIKDYLKINVFQRSIMEETGQKITSALTPVKRFVSMVNLAGNVVSAVRDAEQGFMENFIRTVTKFQTDLEAKNVRDAYNYVIVHGISNAMNITKLSALCAKYRISNTDLNRITERLRTGRGGILNADNWAYATLRSPDFMNRMVLFVARCMQDGCWEAMTVEDNVLKYNWKRDKRFEIYASDNKEHPDYKKQRSLYLSKVQEYNEEHPENQLEYDDHNEIHLPEPYSRKEILSIRNVDRNIYGSYDKSMKAMGEHTAAWWAFGMYTTWMNGIYNNYFMKPGVSQISQRKVVQQRDENGKLLFFDENGGLTTEDTGVPYIKGVPMIVQGIYYTAQEMFKICKDNGFKAMKEYLKEDPIAAQNFKKGLSDLLMSLLHLVLINLALSGQYRDYKKVMRDNPVIQNLIVEVLYKSTSRAWDSFQGPLNILNFVGENMNPPVYQIPIKLISDSGKFLFGEKTFGQIVTGNLAIGRSYSDTYNAWLRAQKQ